MPRIKKLIVDKVLSDDEMKPLKGTFIDESFMKYPLIQNNIDVYYKNENNEEKLLLKFRNKCLTDNEIKLGWNSYKDMLNQAEEEEQAQVLLIQIMIAEKFIKQVNGLQVI